MGSLTRFLYHAARVSNKVTMYAQAASGHPKHLIKQPFGTGLTSAHSADFSSSASKGYGSRNVAIDASHPDQT